ncbi:hypothetical protein H5410_064594 [Solanum commersonii]|uniref:Uncharacterized protein n=1 Tax=Solanum commersonii TaxID=4109 RepID=A0A9J5VYY6_SOLCO|nr:hypothetical protein H5410_064594 [Solanum commersonii]
MLLCEHLDTRPNRNSNPEGNINPKKVAGDVPLAPSAKNISSISMDMPKPESSDKGKSQAIQKDDTSKNEEKIISIKKENSNKVPPRTKIFSSFQVGRQHPNEEQYLAFTKFIYNLPEESGETFGVLGSNSLFPRISIFPNGSPRFTAQLFEFGYLDQVYAKAEPKELSGLPNQLVGSIKNYAQGEGFYCRFFSISMECKDEQVYYPTINYITIEKLKDFNKKVTGVDKKHTHLNKKWIQTKRALGIKALYFILKRFYNEDMKVIDHDHDWVVITKGRSKSKVIKAKILDIELHKLEATEET